MSALSAEKIKDALGDLADTIGLEVLDSCQSTNLLMKRRAESLPDWYVIAADRQSGGRGRLGRSFFSPAGTGLYMSVLLRPRLAAEDMGLLTTAAAVAVCRAAEQLGSDPARIKWVNDVLIRGRKVCGILTEAGPDLRYAVLGAGINVTEPAGGFPPELGSIAGAVFPRGGDGLRERLAAAFLRQLYGLCAALPQKDFIGEYRARSALTGKRVAVEQGGAVREALVLGIDERCRLLVRYPDGTEQALFTGEVSVRQI